SFQAYERQRPNRRFQAGEAMQGNRLLTETFRPCSPATSRVFPLIRDRAHHRQRSISVYGPTLRLSDTFSPLDAAWRRFHPVMSGKFANKAMLTPLSDGLGCRPFV